MTPEQFAYWLQGFMENANPKTLNEIQTQTIKDHLDLVFEKVTPNRNDFDDILKRTRVPSPRDNGTGGETLYCAPVEIEKPYGKNGLIC